MSSADEPSLIDDSTERSMTDHPDFSVVVKSRGQTKDGDLTKGSFCCVGYVR
jgi:hypothetical protein